MGGGIDELPQGVVITHRLQVVAAIAIDLQVAGDLVEENAGRGEMGLSLRK